MVTLQDIKQKAGMIKLRETLRAAGIDVPDDATPIEMLRATGIDIPDNPTVDDFRRVAHQLGQNIKLTQNTEKPWTDEHWRKISKAIEKLEEKK